MEFKILGAEDKPAILFFAPLGAGGESYLPLAEALSDKYCCVLATSTLFCHRESYMTRHEEVRLTRMFLNHHGIKSLKLLFASSTGADMGLYFLADDAVPTETAFFDSGVFDYGSPLKRGVKALPEFLRLKRAGLTGAAGLEKAACRTLSANNFFRLVHERRGDREFPELPVLSQRRCYFACGSLEKGLMARSALMRAYPAGNYPVFEGFGHMDLRLSQPETLAGILKELMDSGMMPQRPFIK